MTVSIHIEVGSGRDREVTPTLFRAEPAGRTPFAFWHAVTVPDLTETELYDILEAAYRAHGVRWEPGYSAGVVFLAPAYRLTEVAA